MIKIYKTESGNVIQKDIYCYKSSINDWDEFLNRKNLYDELEKEISQLQPFETTMFFKAEKKLPPIGSQEIWAAGVTYLRSKVARMEESEDSGGSSFYDKVYEAERPELFFKATPHRVVGDRDLVRIRKDSTWNVPEPELTLVINAEGKIIGYTVGNDMSSRSIEGENPLYLPQAKVYDKSASIGPCVLITQNPLPSSTRINMTIKRNGQQVFEGETSIDQMKRTHEELVGFLYRECSFPTGCYLMTGTCVVPSSDFTLQQGDTIIIFIEHIGGLVNVVE